MFATLINNIPTNAMRKLAFIHAGIFYVRRHSSTTLYRCPSTPVYRLNGHTAFVGECDKQRDRLGHLLFLLCYNTPTLPTPHCLAATERRPTKRAICLSPSTATLTTTLHAWAWTFMTSISACWARHEATACASPELSTSAASAILLERQTILHCCEKSTPNSLKRKPGTAVAASRRSFATRSPLSAAIRTLLYCRPGFADASIKATISFPTALLCSGRQGGVHPYKNTSFIKPFKIYRLWKQQQEPSSE